VDCNIINVGVVWIRMICLGAMITLISIYFTVSNVSSFFFAIFYHNDFP